MAIDITTISVEMDTRSLREGQRQLDRTSQAGNRLAGSTNEIRSAYSKMGAVVGAVGSLFAVDKIINYADEWKQLNAQIRQVTKSEQDLIATRNNLVALSEQTRSGLATTVQLYSNLARATESLNLTQKETESITKTINNLFLAGGKGGAAAAAGITQLSQAFASGVLRGDEFNSVAENAPRILDALTAKLGKNRGELRAMAEQGALTADILSQALLEYSSTAQSLANTTEKTFSQSMTAARNNAVQFVGNSKALNDAFNSLGGGIELLSRNLETLVTVGGAVALVFGVRMVASLQAKAAASVNSIAAASASAKADQSAAVAAARRAEIEKLSAISTLEKARAENIAAVAAVNSARANGTNTQSIAVLIEAQNVAAGTALRLGVATEAAAISSATANAANARLAASNLVVAQTSTVAGAAMKGIQSGMALLGGPLGLAMIAGAAVYYFATKSTEAEDAVKALNPELDGLADRFGLVGQAQQKIITKEFVNQIKEQRAEVEKLAQVAERARNATSGDKAIRSFFGWGGADEANAELEKAREKLSALESQFKKIMPPTVEFQAWYASLINANWAMDALVKNTGNGVRKIWSMFDQKPKAKEEKESDAYKKLNEELKKALSLHGAIGKAKEIQYDIESGKYENLSKKEADSLIAQARILDAKDLQVEKTKEMLDKAEALKEAEKTRAESINDMVASMTREADLMGEQSKEAQLRYDIEKKLLDVKDGINGAEAESLINAARMVDLKKKELDYAEELNKKILADVEEQTSASIQSVGDIFDKAEKDAQALSDALTDALMRGFESGKSFAKNLADSVKNMFKTMVLKPRVEAIVDKVKGYAEKALGSMGGIVGDIAAVGSVVSGIWNNYMDKAFKEMTSEFRQSRQSTGTLLGNANAKSDSINKAINELGDNGKSLLDVNHGMYQALIDIRSGIAGSAAGFARQSLGGAAGSGIKTGTMFNTVNLGDSMAGGFIASVVNSISKAIYNKKTSIIDSGIQILGGTLADAIESGTIGAMNYAEVKTTKKFLGLTTSSKVKTETSDLNEEFKRQFADVFGSAGDALQEASKAFGANFDASKLMIDATKLSLKGLEGDALTKEIESFFSSTLDKWAVSLVDSLGQFQEVGEGAFETMIRLAGETNTFVNYANQLGLKFKETGLNAVIVTQSLADMAGGFDQLNSGMASYYENFFSETEKSQKGLATIGKALGDVGISLPKTREEFRALVESLDLTKEAEQKQFAALMNVNQAFAQLVPATKAASDATTELVNTFDAIADQQRALSEKLFDMTATTAQKQQAALDAALSAENKAIQQQINDIENLNAAKAAQASIDAEAYSLETQRLTLLGDTNALRERELANINPANQAKQKEIWALEDAKAAAETAAQAQEDMAQAARDSAEEQKRLMQGVHDSISGALNALMGESETLNSMTQSQARLTLQNALMTAKAGGSLVGFAGLDDALGAIQKQGTYSSPLESRLAIGRNIGLLSELSKYTKVDGSHANGLESVPYDGYIAQLHKGERVQTAREAQSTGDLAAKVERLIEVVNAGNIAIAQNTAKGAKLLEKWDNDGIPEERSVA